MQSKHVAGRWNYELPHGAKTAAEREALRAVYAYEEALSAKRGVRREPHVLGR